LIPQHYWNIHNPKSGMINLQHAKQSMHSHYIYKLFARNWKQYPAMGYYVNSALAAAKTRAYKRPYA
jgi:hypothetical protein